MYKNDKSFIDLQRRITPVLSIESLAFFSPEGKFSTNSIALGLYQMLWLTTGRGIVNIDGQQHPADSNKIFMLAPSQSFSVTQCEELQGFRVCFSRSFILEADERLLFGNTGGFLQFFAQMSVDINAETFKDLHEVAVKMKTAYESSDYYLREILTKYFKIWLLHLVRNASLPKVACHLGKHTALLSQFNELVEKNFKEKKMVHEYAAELFITPSYLNEVVKKLTGFSAGQHIRARVVLEAKRKAMESACSMKEIAYHLGFADPCHFSKFFKKSTGVNFIAYKKNEGSISA